MRKARRVGGVRWVVRHARPRRWYRVVGRFRGTSVAWRVWWRTWRQLARRRPWLSALTLFDSLPVARAVADLREHGFHAGLRLPPELVARLVEHARRQPCRRGPDDAERFRIDQVVRGRSPSGELVAVAEVEVEGFPVIGELAGDAALVKVVRGHLGYLPTRFAPRLCWTPRSGQPEAGWGAGGGDDRAIDFHYDIESRPSLYLYFYLSDTDAKSGAHVVVAGSHRRKPVRLRWASTRQPDAVVLSVYGPGKLVVLEGLAGFGFFQDPACLYKVLPPRSADRLVLQLRYS